MVEAAQHQNFFPAYELRLYMDERSLFALDLRSYCDVNKPKTPVPDGWRSAVTKKLKPVNSYWLNTVVIADKAKPHVLQSILLSGLNLRVTVPNV